MYAEVVNDPFSEESLRTDAEDIYSAEMDRDIKELLNAIPEKIVDGLNRHARPAPARETGSQQVGERSQWKRWGLILGTIVSALVILGILRTELRSIIADELHKAFEKPNQDFAILRDRDVGGLRSDSQHVREDLNRILDWQARVIMTQPAAVVKPEDIQGAAKRIRDAHLPAPSVQQIEGFARPLLHGPITPVKWGAVTELLNLRSFVNSTLQEANQHIAIRLTFAEILNATPEERKKMDFVGTPGQWVLFSGGRTVLDGMDSEMEPGYHAKRHYEYFIFRDTHVIYRGGQVTLVNVFFDNCTFEVAQGPNGQSFAVTLLKSSFPSIRIS